MASWLRGRAMTATGQAGLRTRATTGIAVAGLHGVLLLLLLLARTDPPPEIPDFPPMLVELVAPQPALRTAPTVGGGGKPSAPSRTHTPPEPPLDRIEILAPPVQAAEQPWSSVFRTPTRLNRRRACLESSPGREPVQAGDRARDPVPGKAAWPGLSWSAARPEPPSPSA